MLEAQTLLTPDLSSRTSLTKPGCGLNLSGSALNLSGSGVNLSGSGVNLSGSYGNISGNTVLGSAGTVPSSVTILPGNGVIIQSGNDGMWGISYQPTLTELARPGTAIEQEADYLCDSLYPKYGDLPCWQEDGKHSTAQFLEQNGLSNLTDHTLPPESLAYLAEDNNSFMELENEQGAIDVMGDGVTSFREKVSLNSPVKDVKEPPSWLSTVSLSSPVKEAPSWMVPFGNAQTTSKHLNTLQTTSNIDINRFSEALICLQLHNNLGGHCLPHKLPSQHIGFDNYHKQTLAAQRPAISRFNSHQTKLKQNKISSCKKKRSYEKRKSEQEQIESGKCLWQFLLRELGSNYRSDILEWTGNDLEFKILNKEKIAIRWGTEKGNEKMNFDKLSRSLRYYYKERILIHSPQRRLTYCFMRNPADIVFSKMLQLAMRSLPHRLPVCSAACNIPTHFHEMQYEKRKVRK